MPNTYIACSMSGLAPEEYKSFRHTILEVCEVIRTLGYIPYSEPFEAVEFDSPENALKKNLEVLDGADRFVLLYTNKEASSALIELGYALKRGLPIVVFAQEGIKRPFYLRQSYITPDRSIRVESFMTLQDLPIIVKRLLK